MKILIIRVSAIGDVIHTLPALFLLKTAHPNMQISWVVQKKAAPLLVGQPFLDHVWVLADRFLMPQHLAQTFAILKEIRAQQWDAIIDFQGLLKTSLLLMTLCGKKYGFDWHSARESASSMFTHHQVAPTYRNIIQKNLELASSVLNDLLSLSTCPTLDTLKKSCYLAVPEAKQAMVNAWIATHNLSNIIALCPNTTWQSKRWPLQHWLTLITLLPSNYAIVLIGKDFGDDAAQIARLTQERGLALFTLPKWDLLTTTYFIQQIKLLIAPDTSFLHIADFLGIPAIGLFGPTSKEMHGPFLTAQNHAHALQAPCSHHYQKSHGVPWQDCMGMLTPEMVLRQVGDILVAPSHHPTP